MIFTLFFLSVVFLSAVLLMQCIFTDKIDWNRSGLVAGLLLVYGFPYMLAIPSVWDIALKSTVEKMQELKLPQNRKGNEP